MWAATAAIPAQAEVATAHTLQWLLQNGAELVDPHATAAVLRSVYQAYSGQWRSDTPEALPVALQVFAA